MGADAVLQLFHRKDGFISPVARNKKLALQLRPAAGREVDTEMRQPFVPRARNAHLLGAIFRGMTGQGVKFPGCELGPIKLRREFERLAGFDAPFYPDLSGAMILPVGKETDAVGTGKNVVQMFFQLSQRELFVNDLPPLNGWLQVASD